MVGVAVPAGFDASVVADLAPNKPPPPNKLPPAAGVVDGAAAGAAGAPKRDVGALAGWLVAVAEAVVVVSAGFAPKENVLPPAAEGAAGVVLPDAAPPNSDPVAGAGVAGFDPNKPPVFAVLAGAAGVVELESAGLAPNREVVGGCVVGVVVPDATVLPNNPPLPAGFAPNKLVVGGGAAGVVVCPNPPKVGLLAGVVLPAGWAVEAGLPKEKPPDGAAGVVVEGAAGVVPKEKGL